MQVDCFSEMPNSSISTKTNADLWDLADHWRMAYLGDPNGEDFIDIRDFLFINIEDLLGCP